MQVLNSINVDHIAESSLPIDLGEVEETQGTKVVTMADVHRSEDLQLDSLASQSLGRVQELVEDTVTMETKYYSSDNVQFWVLYKLIYAFCLCNSSISHYITYFIFIFRNILFSS